MLHNHVFLRKTKKGSVAKIVKEHYLRTDIACGSKACTTCTPCKRANLAEALPPFPGSQVGEYIVPDTNVLFHHLDVIEHPSISNLVILQTVLEELRHRSFQCFQRVRRLIDDPDRHFYVFSNDFHAETYVPEPAATASTTAVAESPNDRNDRAIRRAVQWYNAHLAALHLGAVLVTNDVANRQLAVNDGIPALSLRDFVQKLPGSVPLLDMLGAAGDDPTAPSSKDAVADASRLATVYPEHAAPASIQAGIATGVYQMGTLHISPHNFQEATLLADVNKQRVEVLISGRMDLNRAMDGDVVAFQLFPKEQWKSIVSKVQEQEDDDEAVGSDADAVDDDDDDDDDDDAAADANASASSESLLMPTARVVGIVKRNWRPLCGTLEAPPGFKQHVDAAREHVIDPIQSAFFWPIDKRMPKVRVRTRQLRHLLGQRIVVALDAWPQNSRYPTGHFVRVLGAVGDRAAESEALLLEHDIAHAPFNARVLACLPHQGDRWTVDVDTIDKPDRVDLRHLAICSIDPPGCTDIDDALHARPLPNGNIEAGVHIADVSYFVKPDTPMDIEASQRCTSVYLVDKRIDMLPTLLGTNLCSLRSNVDRLAFSCVWEMTPAGEVVSTRFHKSMIRSQASFTYDEAQARINDTSMNDTLSTNVRLLNQLAKALRKRRIAAGAVTLASPEVKFRLDDKEQQDPVDVEMKELMESNQLVEEFMLLANIHVARKIQQAFPDAAMLRCHPAPPSNRFDALIRAVGQRGFPMVVDTSKHLSDSLDAIQLPEDPYFNKLVRIMTTRCMQQAAYICAGSVNPSGYWHYGLATDIYTHFTSPIRRYADLIVHRMLHAAILRDGQLARDRMKRLADVLNVRHRNAQMASRASIVLFTNLFFRNKPATEEAYILRVLKNAVIVLIPKYGIENAVVLPKASLAKCDFDEKDIAITWPADAASQTRAGKLALFQKIKVHIEIVHQGPEAAQRLQLQLTLVDPPLPAA
ncbi:hypothetical protein CXG81DRAFT_12153 [Caulochytrium protostelioides]|uniref:Ribosomal RNA-processing protein 44 n=1 Tax=Caulochytrium protostelioides TaxID=1555241 RepID=A0A4P9X7V5_9FUNG|nr:hypothetical protein CXG81DRAFT_12153 [Caulochytrium protostelioides]|eukprot:RKP01318.1 hypothetical protein CXG81DRAFT_12153 [Caulochytrium protostelioides]